MGWSLEMFSRRTSPVRLAVGLNQDAVVPSVNSTIARPFRVFLLDSGV